MKKLAIVLCLTWGVVHAGAAPETWFEVKSPHFTVWANANDGNTRTLVWQLEQVRSAMSALWPWAKTDLPKPMLVLAAKDENSVKALAPEFWERKGAVHPVSVWVTGVDRHYMVIRSDVRGDDKAALNPYTSTYFSYVHLILQSSFARQLPLWFSRGLAGVMSNTVVRNNEILIGPPIPWHLESLREGTRLPLAQLVAVTPQSPEYTQGNRLGRFDAQSWAFVHYLMFADQGAHRPKINKLVALLTASKEAGAAFTEAIGRAEDYEGPLNIYVNRSLFSYERRLVDADVPREKLTARPIAPAEAAGGRALFHVAMDRPIEAKALIAEARAVNPDDPDAFAAEAVQLDLGGRRDEAKAAYARAADLGSPNPYILYRAAVLNWPQPTSDTQRWMEKHLARAVEITPSFADAHAALAEVRARLGQPAASVMPLIARAVQLEPFNPWHRLTAARILMRLESPVEALKSAQVGLTLAGTEEAKQEAQRLVESIQRAQEGRGPRDMD